MTKEQTDQFIDFLKEMVSKMERAGLPLNSLRCHIDLKEGEQPVLHSFYSNDIDVNVHALLDDMYVKRTSVKVMHSRYTDLSVVFHSQYKKDF